MAKIWGGISELAFTCPFGEKNCLFSYEPEKCTGCRDCTYCGKYLLWNGSRRNIHYDHVRPYVSGGRTIVPVCNECNLSKSSKGLKEWLRWVRDNWPSKWNAIVEYNKWRRNVVANVVRDVRDEA